jgi:hypothetical protein
MPLASHLPYRAVGDGPSPQRDNQAIQEGADLMIVESCRHRTLAHFTSWFVTYKGRRDAALITVVEVAQTGGSSTSPRSGD